MTNLNQEILFPTQTQPENERLALLKQHFPNCFDKHGAFLPDKLAEILHSDGIHTQKEGYSLNWLGKSYARVLKDTPPETLLAEDTEHNRQPENANSENLLIKGDNLEVLKHLKNAYKNQIKMIYIDPPYNTGSDGFVYQDDRKFTPEQLAELGGMSLEEAERVLEFTAKKSNSHSAWLTFMYPRLYVARELLRDDGVIFISIDDNEQAQLKILCDEVFWEENFVGNIAWEAKTKSQNTKDSFNKLQPKIEHIFVYGRQIKTRFNLQEIGKKDYPLSDEKGIYRLHEVGSMNREGVRGRESMVFTILDELNPPEGQQWKLGKETIDEFVLRNDVFIQNGKVILKMRPDDERNEITEPFWAFIDKQIGTAESAKKELTNLIDKHGFETVKPMQLIKKLVLHVANPDDLVIDFFAGSGTTAHAVMQLNAEDNGNRRFICVQLSEKTDEKSEAYKAGYETIFDITKARIQKASQKIKNENPNYSGDLGFKIFETVPNFQAALTDDFNPQQADLPDTKDAALSDEQLHTLLTTWRVYDGCRLPEKVQTIDLAGYTAYYCRQHLYLLASGFHSECVKALIEKLDNDKDFVPERIVLFSANMDSAMQKELAQAVKTYANKKGLNNLSVLARV